MGTDAAPNGATDSSVTVAFALGWQIEELEQIARGGGAVRATSSPALTSLTDAQREELGYDQIEVALGRLTAPVTNAGLAQKLDHTKAALQLLRQGNGSLEQLQVAIVQCLTAADFRLGKAYGLGRLLCDTCHPPEGRSLRQHLDRERVANLAGWLSDLTSVLPARAGHAVRSSLLYWQRWVEEWPEADPSTVEQFRRQGELWRALLSDEKAADDGLSLQDYVATAGNTLLHASSLAGRFLTRFWWIAVAVVALFAAGMFLIVTNKAAHDAIAGIGALLASAGLTWKAVGATLGKAGQRLEGPVWEAELDQAIAYAVTVEPVRDAIDREPPGITRRVARRIRGAKHIERATLPRPPSG